MRSDRQRQVTQIVDAVFAELEGRREFKLIDKIRSDDKDVYDEMHAACCERVDPLVDKPLDEFDTFGADR